MKVDVRKLAASLFSSQQLIELEQRLGSDGLEIKLENYVRKVLNFGSPTGMSAERLRRYATVRKGSNVGRTELVVVSPKSNRAARRLISC